jgi:spermidine synthase
MIVSGGMQGMIREVKKYKSVKEIDYVEINPALIEAEHVFSEPFTGKGTNIIIRDARKLIRNTNTKYDAIIVNTPDPSNALINRYFTYEFFDEARRALRPNGILEVALSPTLNYLNNDAISVNSIIYATLKKAFRNVIIITGEKNYYLASEAPLSNKIVSLLQNTSIINDYVNRYYFDDELIVQKSNMILDQLNSGSSINRDLFPVAYFSQISQWINKSEGDHAPFVMLIIAIIILAIPGIMLFRNIQTLSTPILTSAFAGASAEFLLVIVFQTLFGYIYLLLGLIVAFYMAGLAVGTLVKFNYRIKSIKIFYLILQMILIVLILLIPLITYIGIRFPHIPPTVLQGILLLLTAAITLVCGLIYNTASQLFDENSGKIAAKLYMIDLSGGAAGMLLVSFILLPLTGIWGTVIVITGILLSGVVLTMFKAS